jgi:Short C-terminal domain
VSLRTVGLLLAVWCLLAIAPALVIAVFMGVDTADPSGTILLIWICGYLAQIGVFLAITLKAGGGSFLGWLIASLVPWSANWVAPISPWWLIACAVVVCGYAWWFYRSLARSRSLQHDGVPARGVVRTVHEPSDTIADQLQRLAELRRRGDLTEAEFAAAKRRILNG